MEVGTGSELLAPARLLRRLCCHCCVCDQRMLQRPRSGVTLARRHYLLAEFAGVPGVLAGLEKRLLVARRVAVHCMHVCMHALCGTRSREARACARVCV